MKKDFTYIAVVLDRSGSMSFVTKATIDGFNEFLKGQKATPGTAKLTLVQFDHEIETVVNNQDIAAVEPLTDLTYVPRGSTALLDAIGKTMDGVGDILAGMVEADRPDKVVFVIITDGEENASHKFSRQQIFDKISHQRDVYKWDFMFLGANQDAIQAGNSIGINSVNSSTYHSTVRGSSATFNMVSAKLMDYRTLGKDRLGFTPAEQQTLASTK